MAVVDPNGIYSAKDVCEIFQCSTTTLWRMRKKGLKMCVPGGVPMFMGSDILAYMRSTKIESTDKGPVEVRANKAQLKLQAKLVSIRS